MKKEIRILHVAPGLDSGGIAKVIYNYYSRMDGSIIKFDFAIFNPEVGLIEEKLLKMGCKVYHITQKKQDYKKFKQDLEKIFTNNAYDAIHAHQNLMSFFVLYYAKRFGIKNRIIHSHNYLPNVGVREGVIRNIAICLNSKLSTKNFACGIGAAEYVYGKKAFANGLVEILPNAIEVNEFKFNSSIREHIRKKYGLENKFIIGHVGRLSYEKNQGFLIDIIQKLKDSNKNIVLLLIGNGPDEEELRRKIQDLRLEEYIKMLGKRDDVSAIQNAMDLFLLPSLFEAFPLTAIEAQVNGLKSILSDRVHREVIINQNVCSLSIDSGVEIWVDKIKTIIDEGEYSREMHPRMQNYDINENVKRLQTYYLNEMQ